MLKENYIRAIKEFKQAEEMGYNINSYNRTLCLMETAHGDKLRKEFNVPKNEVLYGFVKDKYCKN